MKVVAFLRQLRELGIELRLDEQDALVCNAPKGVMTPEIGETIKRHKAEILAILRRNNRDKWSTLVPIQPHGELAPFFCFHGVGGNVLNYSVLAQYLDPGQPFYGLQSVGLDGTTPPLTDISSMVAHYAREIRTIQPRGPYYLGGGSMGGVVAYEMARQFRQAGEEIGLLILFDTIGPNQVVTGTPPPSRISSLAGSLAGRSPGSQLAFLWRKGRCKAEFQRKRLICRSHLLLRRPIPLDYRFWYIEQMNFKAIRAYPFPPYDGELVLIRGDLIADGGFLSDPLRGWTGVAGAVQVHAIGGQHETLIEQPELGRTLARCLREARR